MSLLRVLIVEDNRQLAENLFEFLGEEAYQLDHAADGLTALHLLATNAYDVIVLDVGLPGVDGLTLCRRLREDLRRETPVLFLTARDSIDDKALGFRAGADDYLVKPFNLRELEMRLQALTRRSRPSSGQVEAGGFIFNPGTLEVLNAQGKRAKLVGYHATILENLLRAHPNLVTYQALSQALWGIDEGDLSSLRTHVYSLRKLLAAEFGRGLIRTHHGRGYSFDPEWVD